MRFVIEFVRVDVRVLGPLSVAHPASLLAIAAGIGLLMWPMRAQRTAASAKPD